MLLLLLQTFSVKAPSHLRQDIFRTVKVLNTSVMGLWQNAVNDAKLRPESPAGSSTRLQRQH